MTTAKKSACGKSSKRLYLTMLDCVFFRLLLSMSMSIMVLSGSIDRLMFFFVASFDQLKNRFETAAKLVFRDWILYGFSRCKTKYITHHGKIWLKQHGTILRLAWWKCSLRRKKTATSIPLCASWQSDSMDFSYCCSASKCLYQKVATQSSISSLAWEFCIQAFQHFCGL